MNDAKEQIQLIAFAEPMVSGTSEQALLLVYIINESLETLEVLNDLDSINIPKDLPEGLEPISDADLIHIDFGVSGEAKYIRVAPSECLKVTLILRQEQLALLNNVRQMKTSLKFKKGNNQESEVSTVLLLAKVYMINL